MYALNAFYLIDFRNFSIWVRNFFLRGRHCVNHLFFILHEIKFYFMWKMRRYLSLWNFIKHEQTERTPGIHFVIKVVKSSGVIEICLNFRDKNIVFRLLSWGFWWLRKFDLHRSFLVKHLFLLTQLSIESLTERKYLPKRVQKQRVPRPCLNLYKVKLVGNLLIDLLLQLCDLLWNITFFIFF